MHFFEKKSKKASSRRLQWKIQKWELETHDLTNFLSAYHSLKKNLTMASNFGFGIFYAAFGKGFGHLTSQILHFSSVDFSGWVGWKVDTTLGMDPSVPK